MRHKRAIHRKRRARPFLVETLEPRRVLAACELGENLGELITSVGGGLSNTHSQLTEYWSNHPMPLLDRQLDSASKLLEGASVAVSQAIDELPGALSNFEDPTEDEIHDALTEVLEARFEQANYEVNVVAASCQGDDLTIEVDLSRSESLQLGFDIGLAPVPIFSLDSTPRLNVGLDLDNLKLQFGLIDGEAYFNPDQFDVSMYADFTGTEFEATVGLLAGTITTELQDAPDDVEVVPPGYASPLELSLTMDLQSGITDVEAGSHFNLIFAAGGESGFLASLPSVQATVAVDWYGPERDDPLPEVEFKGVQVQFGGLVSKVLEPIVDHLGPIIDKIGAAFKILDWEIPVLDRLLEPDPTLMDILKLTANAGSEEYKTAVKILDVIHTVVEIVDSFESVGGELVIDLGSFELPEEVDLRTFDFGEATLEGLAGFEVPELSAELLGDEFDLDSMQEWTVDPNTHMNGELAGLVNSLLESLRDPLELQFPLLQKPAQSIFSLLLGQDVDFFRFDAVLNVKEGFGDELEIPDFSLPGFSFRFGNVIEWDMELGLGMDTRGIRRFIHSKVNEGDPTEPYHFGDGFYITPSTHFGIGAGLEADVGVNVLGVLHGHVVGGVTGELFVRPTPSQEWFEDPAKNPEKVYIRSDMGDCLGEAGGGISAFLDAWVGIGAQVPFSGGKFIGGKKEFHIAKADLFKFPGLCIPNPFRFDAETFEPATTRENVKPGDPNIADIDTGELWLNVGDRSDIRGYLPSVEDEAVYVEHLETIDGLDTVRVTFGGQSKDYTGIHTILAYAGSGADFIQIGEKVTAYVELWGGDEGDTLESFTAGTSRLFGEVGDDFLTGGLGASILRGGLGNDQLTAGSGTNLLIGGFGNDVLIGSAGKDTLHGDELVAGPMDGDDTIQGRGGFSDYISGGGGNDVLRGCSDDSDAAVVCAGASEIHGGAGNDTIFAGPDGDVIFGGDGSDEIHAGSGDDVITTHDELLLDGPLMRNFVYWEAGDGNATIINSAYSINTVSLFGSDANDSFEVGDGHALPLAGNEFEIQVEAPGRKTVTMTNVSHLNVDGLDQADTVVLNPLTFNNAAPHPLADITVNLAPEFRDDGEEDHIYIVGTDDADILTVDAVQMLLVVPDSCPVPNQIPGDRFAGCVWGGVMTVSGFKEYTIYATNVADDLQLFTGKGADDLTVNANTGPTRIDAGQDDDLIRVNAQTLGHPPVPNAVPVPADYFAELTVDASSGRNELHVLELASEIADQIHVDEDHVWSQLLPRVNYSAIGGNFGVLQVVGGLQDDTLHVYSTSPDVEQTIVSGYFNPAAIDVPVSDWIFISSTGASDGDLLGIRNRFTVQGHNDTPTMVVVSDRTAVDGNTLISVTDNKITGFAGATDDAVIEAAWGGILEFHLYGSDDPTLAESFVLDDPARSVFVYGGEGDEQMTVLSTDRPLWLLGEAGADRVSIPIFGRIQAPVDVEGGTGADVATVHDEFALAGGVYLLAHDSIERLTSVVNFDDSLETLDAFTSNQLDSVIVSSVPDVTSLRIDQGGGINSLYGPGVNSEWNISALNAGTLNQKLSFVSTHNLIGGIANDHFRIANGAGISGLVFGGSGAGFDTLDYSQYLQPVVLVLTNASGDGVSTNVGTFGAFERLTGSASVLDELYGFAGNHLWEVTANDAGVYHGPISNIEFQSVESLIGSLGDDQFQLHPSGRLTGRIDGGGGGDTLDYSLRSLGVTVDLLSGQATGVARNATLVENVLGSGGDDYLWGDDLNNKLKGAGGNDVLVGRGGVDQLDGGGGRDLLIGGAGADVIHGSGGDDILIGGTTSYDSKRIELERIMSEWLRNDIGYLARVDHLRNGGGYNGSVRLNNATVQNNDAIDELFGQGGQDWFFGVPLELEDLVAGEQQN